LAQHRSNEACASCHALMDPIGFALDHYDAIGRYRNFDGDTPIDSSGLLPDGTMVNDVEDLEAAIMSMPEMVVGCLTEKLMTFALGRTVDFRDAAAIRRIVRHASQNEYRFSALVHGIVRSDAFRSVSSPSFGT
ncbi:MAG: DUF1585 domain-containing protein, partial [Planctomycetota bacterium]